MPCFFLNRFSVTASEIACTKNIFILFSSFGFNLYSFKSPHTSLLSNLPSSCSSPSSCQAPRHLCCTGHATISHPVTGPTTLPAAKHVMRTCGPIPLATLTSSRTCVSVTRRPGLRRSRSALERIVQMSCSRLLASVITVAITQTRRW